MVHRVEILDEEPSSYVSQWRAEHFLPALTPRYLVPKGPIWLGNWHQQNWQCLESPQWLSRHLQQTMTVLLPPESEYEIHFKEMVAEAEQQACECLVLSALQHYSKGVRRVAALAQACYVSERSLHRAFLAVYGESPSRVLRALRLRHCLRQAGIPRAVGADTGPYVDYSHFFREFYALTGFRPSQLQALRQFGSPDPSCLNGT